MREIKLRYICKDMCGEMFILHTDIRALESGEFILGKLGRIQEVVARNLGTGLCDKNGTEIYEGDIVAINGGAEPEKTSVFFEHGCFCIDMRGKSCELKYYINMTFCETEVVGNVQENPDLLDSVKHQK